MYLGADLRAEQPQHSSAPTPNRARAQPEQRPNRSPKHPLDHLAVAPAAPATVRSHIDADGHAKTRISLQVARS